MRIEQLGQAVGAGGGVGGDLGIRGLALRAFDDLEPAVADRLPRFRDHPVDRGQRRRLSRQPGQEPLHGRVAALHLDQHAVRIVQDEPGQTQLTRQPEHVGAESDPLHRAVHAHMLPAQRGHAHRLPPAPDGSTSPRST